MGCIVVCVVTYAMILPAITLEGDYYCGLEEHQHTEECYSLNEEGETVLICPLPEHVHDEHCLVPPVEPKEEHYYLCGIPYEHQHTESCYQDGALVCSLKEHQHSENCFATLLATFEELPAEALTDAPAEEPQPEEAPSEPAQPAETESAEPPAEDTPPVETETPQPEEASLEENLPEVVESEENPPEEASLEENPPEVVESEENPPEEASLEENPPEEPATEENGPQEELPEVPQPEDTPSEESVDRAEPSAETLEMMEFMEEVAKEDAFGLMSLPGSVLGSAGESFFDDPEATYFDLSTLTGTTVSYEITYNGDPIDPNMAGEGYEYGFSLSITGSMRNYNTLHCLYWLKLEDFSDVTLYYASGTSLIPLEDYAADWVWIKRDDSANSTVQTKFKRDAEGYYWVFFCTPTGTTRSVSIRSAATSSRVLEELSIEKDGVWDERSLAYRYTLTAFVPRVVNQLDQAYRILDSTIITGTSTATYNGLLQNIDNGTLAVSFSDGTPIPAITDASSNPAVNVAWYMDEQGSLWLMTRKEHSEPCLTTSPTDAYPGWCSCWTATTDSTILVTYVDTWGQQYFGQNRMSTFTNLAYLRDNKGNSVEDRVSLPNITNLLEKQFSGAQNTFTITVNNMLSNLSEFGTIHVTDSMESASVRGEISVLRKASSGESGTYLTEGVDYEIEMKTFGFDVVLYHPGRYIYVITYGIELIDPEQTSIGNTVAIADTGITKTVTGVYDSVEYDEDSEGYRFDVNLTKLYQSPYLDPANPYLNPAEGAVFGLFDAETGELIANSIVEDGIRYTQALIGDEVIARMSYPYEEGGVSDRITFDMDIGMDVNTVYYIEEITPPEFFQFSDVRTYFYFSDPEGVIPEPDLTPYEDAGIHVIAVNEWEKLHEDEHVWDYASYTFEEPFVNAYSRYELPETGGTGYGLCYLIGVVALLTGAILLVSRRRRAGI